MSSSLLECMMICSFHHLHGPVVEWVYPARTCWSLVCEVEFGKTLPMMAMPDGMHLTSEGSFGKCLLCCPVVRSIRQRRRALIGERNVLWSRRLRSNPIWFVGWRFCRRHSELRAEVLLLDVPPAHFWLDGKFSLFSALNALKCSP